MNESNQSMDSGMMDISEEIPNSSWEQKEQKLFREKVEYLKSKGIEFIKVDLSTVPYYNLLKISLDWNHREHDLTQVFYWEGMDQYDLTAQVNKKYNTLSYQNKENNFDAQKQKEYTKPFLNIIEEINE